MKKPDLEAEAAYLKVHEQARELLAWIGELLSDMPAPGDDEHPMDWLHVGSMGHVNELLSQLVAFLEGSES